MQIVYTPSLTDEALQAFDSWMIEAGLKVPNVPTVVDAIWGEVLSELSKRDLVTLVEGNFKNPGDAMIRRNYK